MKWYSLILLFLFNSSFGLTVSIKQFGAVGNGISSDNDAFLKASEFINKKKKNITLLIPAGTYIVGKQEKGLGNSFCAARNLIELTGCSSIQFVFQKGAIIKYANGLLYGSFDPKTQLPYTPKLPFTDKSYAAQLGCFILLQDCSNIQIKNLVADGNSDNLVIGGRWGDTGIQLAHYGILVVNCSGVQLSGCYLHHFALDGISVTNSSTKPANISILNTKSTYNGRGGLTWLGGNGLRAENCNFSHTGRGKISSSPSCGLDLECENANPICNGIFKNCTFENNAGCGIIADMGPSHHNSFTDCTFWGVTNWSVWVQKPSYQFTRCNFYGSFVHGYITTNPEEATRFESCTFEDKLYKGQEPFGTYLLESDGRKLMYFNQCTFTANKKKVMWYNGSGQSTNDKAQFLNCTINVKTNALNQGDFYAVMRKMTIDNLSLNLYSTKSKNYYLSEDGSSITNLNRKEYSK
ncbi:MAG: right-handed parallel beta-helix repeat-containing protein [Chitinophagaceae bacterium]|nr:right-handed parallel beta-helix repeat-containing protein [Chitinophagaceae bacterium]